VVETVSFTVIEAAQRSPEWSQARAGRLTGSRAAVILAKGRQKDTESTQRRDYRLQLVAERITGVPQENFYFNADMQRGVDLEPLAFAAYEAATGEMVRHTGFLSCDDIMAGCSLDGDINGFSGIIELKCPKLATHLGYLGNPASLPQEYAAQVAHNLWISGAAFCDLISFDDRLPKHKQMLRVRIERYNAGVGEYETAAMKFLSEVDAAYNTIMGVAA
jgi:predicted phage-related endonuclease